MHTVSCTHIAPPERLLRAALHAPPSSSAKRGSVAPPATDYRTRTYGPPAVTNRRETFTFAVKDLVNLKTNNWIDLIYNLSLNTSNMALWCDSANLKTAHKLIEGSTETSLYFSVANFCSHLVHSSGTLGQFLPWNAVLRWRNLGSHSRE